MNYFFTTFKYPLGELILVSDERGENIVRLELDKNKEFDFFRKNNRVVEGENAVLNNCKSQLSEYFKLKRREFQIRVRPDGTEFQKRVWGELMKIPYGETISYGAQAQRISHPKAFRAVGGANGKNPIPILIPCHRVVGANGKLTGFSSGLNFKRYLLELEGVSLDPVKNTIL